MKPELLLPAGSPEKLRYALAYGADAVYFGLPMASLRTPGRGEQFTPQNLGEAIEYCRARGVKSYVTVNIFAANHDLKRVIPHLEQLEELKPDAMIMGDPGIFRLARKHAPSVPVHLSTQANTLNVEACAFWQDLGVERVILAREVPMREIAEIHEALPDLELEAFVHGSLCVAYSGRCVISDYLTDNTKNSNKGMCGNSCRWEFEENKPDTLKSMQMKETSRPDEVYTFEEDEKGSYMLNSRDLCLVSHLKDLQNAGVVSFKIEGRTKSIFYLATVGRVYREAIDTPNPTSEQLENWTRALMQAGNRGFTTGFLNGRPDNSAIHYESSDSVQESDFVANLDAALGQGMRIQARNPLKVGDRLTWNAPGVCVESDLTNLLDSNHLPLQALQTNQVGIIPNPPAEILNLSSEQLPYVLLSRRHMPAKMAVCS